MIRQGAKLVGTDGQHHHRVLGRRERGDGVEEPAAFAVVAAKRERFFELVDEHDPAGRSGVESVECLPEFGGGVRTRGQRDRRPVPTFGKHARRQRGQEARTHERRLTTTRRTDNGEDG